MKYVKKSTGQAWHGRRRTAAQLAEAAARGEKPWSQRKAERSQHAAEIHFSAIQERQIALAIRRAEAHRAWLFSWHTTRVPNCRHRLRWVWHWAGKCKGCGLTRYGTWRLASQIAVRGSSGRWVVRSTYLPRRGKPLPSGLASSKPLGDCRCSNRLGGL